MEANSPRGAEHQPPVGEADSVSKTFGETRALVDVSLNVAIFIVDYAGNGFALRSIMKTKKVRVFIEERLSLS